MKNNPNKYWNKERCLESALKYQTKGEWITAVGSGAYCAAHKNGWLDECTAHMRKRKPNGYWTKERCIEDALRFNTKTEWQQNDSTPTGIAIKNGWFEECTAHMTKNKPFGYWTTEICLKSAKKFKSIKEWSIGDTRAYQAASRLKCLTECTKHMEERYKPKHWTLEKCMESALKCIGRYEWSLKDSTAYKAAKRNGWFNLCTAHMTLYVRYEKVKQLV
jgi:hypothetical protein